MNNWRKVKLDTVADIKLSNVDKKTTEGEKPIRLCNYTDVYKYSFINREKSKDFMIATCNENEYDKFLLKKGQVAITKDSEKRNDIGIPTYIAEDFDDVVLGYHLALITPHSDKLDGAFLHFWLNTEYGKKYFENNASGSGQRLTLTLDIIKSIPLYLPDLPTQKSIAKVLSDLDAKIELNNKINRELEAMAKTLYDYWFVQFDFPNQEGKPYKSSGGKMVYNAELKREIPEGWEVKELGGLGDFKNGVNYDPSNPGEIACPIINVRNISASSFFIQNEDLDIIYLSESDVRKYSVNANSIIIARSGIPGATRLISDIAENTLYCGFAIHYSLNDLDFKIPIFFFLKSLEEHIQSGSGGTILKNVNQGTLKALKIALPKENSTVMKFNNLIEPIFGKITNVKRQNQHLTALRDWLLPMLMNGQVVTTGSTTVREEEEKLSNSAERSLSMAAEPRVEYKTKPRE